MNNLRNFFLETKNIRVVDKDISKHFLPQKISFKGVAITLKDTKNPTPNKIKWFAVLTQNGILGPKSIINDNGMQIKLKERIISHPGFIIPYTNDLSLMYFITSRESITKLNEEKKNIIFEEDVKEFLYPIKSINKPVLIKNVDIPTLYTTTDSIEESVSLIQSDGVSKDRILFNMIKTGLHTYISSLTHDVGQTRFNIIEPVIQNYNNIINNISLIESKFIKDNIREHCNKITDVKITKSTILRYNNEFEIITSIKKGSLEPVWKSYTGKKYEVYDKYLTEISSDICNVVIHNKIGMKKEFENIIN